MAELLNPYIAGAPVTEARMFFGREDVFAWIERSLSGQYVDHILVLHGQRRVGKTSVLKQLPHHLPERYIPVFFDLQGRTHTSLDRFLWWLAREIVRVLKQDRGITAVVPDREAFTQDPEYLESQFLPGLRPHLRGCNLLLTFDEFDTLQEPEIRQTLGQALVEILRRLMGREGLNFIYSIGSSGRKLENMQASYTEFFKAALYKKVSFLGREDALRLITLPVEGVLEYEAKAAERIVGITSGHPYFTQLLCHELFSQCQKTGARRITEADVEAVLEDVVERGTVNLKFVWDEAADLEKWILAGLAQPGASMDLRSLGETLRRQRVRFADRDLESGLLHLREKDVLTPENDFIIHLMRLWLQKNRPLEQVREELVERNPIASRYLEIGLEYLDTGLEEKALESFRQVLTIDPHNLAAHVRIGEVHLRQRRYAEAAAEFEKAMAIDDEDVTARTGMCEARLALGDQALARGRAKEASAAFQQVLAINPEHGEARQRLADLARQAAEKALADGRDEEALASFEEAIGYAPEDPALEARYRAVREEKKSRVLAGLRATAARETSARNWAKAIRALEQGLELAPEDAGLIELLRQTRASEREDRLHSLPEKARSLAAAERWDEALAAWQDYLGLEPLDPERAQAETEGLKASQALAQTYSEAQAALARKDYDQAIPILKGIVARDETYKESTRLLLQAIEARRRARPKLSFTFPKFRFRWKGIRLSRRAWLGLAAGLVTLALGGVAVTNWDQIVGSLSRGTASPATPVAASDVKVCLLAEADGIADAYYAPIWSAIEAAQTTYGIEAAYVEGTDETNITERMAAFLGEGCDLIVSYWPFAEAMQVAAADHPEAQFLVVDSSVDTDVANILGLQFKTWEAAFLAGYVAAGMTQTGRVGTFGGMNIPPVTEYMDAFARGVEYYNQVHSSEVIVLGRNPTFQTGLFIDSFDDETLALWASEDLIHLGADILFPVAGPLGAAAAEPAQGRERVYVIGSDFDWAQASPRYASVILTSAEKDYEGMVMQAIQRVVEGSDLGALGAGTLENEGVGLASFYELAAEVPTELAAELEALQQGAPALSDPNAAHYSFPFDTITAIADGPSNPDLLYLGTEHAGIYRSEDGGQTWQPARNGLGGGAITSLAIHGADPKLLFASVGLAGVYRSTDGGDTWQAVNQGIDLEPLIGWGSTVVLDPYRYPVLWFADGGSVYQSTDLGETWIEHEPQDFQFSNLVADPSEMDSLFATSSFEESGEGPSVHVSHDGGQTWTRLLELDTDYINPGQFAVDPVEGRRLYVSSASGELGTYASSDSGATWERVLELGCDYLAPEPGSSTNAYCAHGAGVWRSIDGGQTWQRLTDVAPSSSPVRVLIASSGAAGYFAATWDGLYVSTNLGITWSGQSNGLPLAYTDLTLVSGAGPRLYATIASGEVAHSGVNAFDWEQDSSLSHRSWAIQPDGEVVYATDGERLWQFTVAASTWDERSAPPGGVGRLTINETYGWIYSLYGQGESAALSISTDGGESWESTSGLYAISDGLLIFDRAGLDRVYAVGYGELYRSDGRGRSWRPCSWTGPPTSSSNSRALVDPDSIDRLLVATRGGGILISEDGCQSWSASNDGLNTLFVNTLAVDPSDSDTFYAATDAGAYVSEDDGASWAPLAGWFEADSLVYSLVVDPLNPGVLYAATPEGVFRWELAPTPVPLAETAATTTPSWVADFAQPILAVLPGRQPLFEGDFSTGSGEWELSDGVTAADGALRFQITNTEATVGRDFGTPHFALRVDFTPRRLGESTPIGLIFRHDGNGYEGFELYPDPDSSGQDTWVASRGWEDGTSEELGRGLVEALGLGSPTRIDLIALGDEMAIYLNEQPIFYVDDSTFRGESISIIVKSGQGTTEVDLDNVVVWDISDYTAAPPTATAAAPPPTVTAAEPWVTDFAEPILEAIEGRTPYFTDDFTSPSPLWGWGWGLPISFEDGSLRMDASGSEDRLQAYLRDAWLREFAEVLDLTIEGGAPEVCLIWGGGGTTFAWETCLRPADELDSWSWQVAGCPQELGGCEIGETESGATSTDRYPTVRVLLIKYGSEFALYLEDQPIAYINPESADTRYPPFIHLMPSPDGQSIIRIDNVQIWDLSDLSLP